MIDNTTAASDYRSSQHQHNPPSTSASSHPTLSYSQAAKSATTISFPKKDQAIIIGAIDQVKLSDYIKSLASITGPENIIFASRVSNNRICVYLSSAACVDTLIATHNSIKVGEHETQIRRLVTPSKRVLISNVCPSIPHSVVEDSFKSLGINMVSPITFLKAGIPGEGYGHILSFRRQVYIFPLADENELQSSLVIN